MDLIPWVLSSLALRLRPKRRIDRWANPHLSEPRNRRARQDTPHRTLRTEREDRAAGVCLERREAWNMGK